MSKTKNIHTVWIYSIISVLAIIGVVLGNSTSLFGSNLSLAESFILAILGVMLGALAFDNVANSESIKNSLATIQNNNNQILRSLGDLNVYSILLGRDKISESVNAEIKKAKKTIKETNFKGSNFDDSYSNGRPNSPYYELVATQIRDENVNYKSVFNQGTALVHSKKAFVTSGIIEESKRNRIRHFESNTKQSYLNVLIIDKRVAFIGFPNNENDKYMQTVIKIYNYSKEGSEFIDNLYEWYEDFIIKNSTEHDFNELFIIESKK